MNEIEQLGKILSESKNAVFFGGAGMSTESGIPDFRSANGIYNRRFKKTLRPEEIVTHSFFMSSPADFFEFYRTRIVYLDAKPNAGHFALAELEKRGILSAVVTQNIDGLHQAAGSKNVYELHGSIHRSFCVNCGEKYDMNFIMENKPVPHCPKCGGIVRPDVVLYEENLEPELVTKVVGVIAKADTLIVGGTSLAVYPAAGFIDYFNGEYLVIINKTETHADREAELIIRENIGETLSEAVRLLDC
jgi:NAD-dependent deacetylase